MEIQRAQKKQEAEKERKRVEKQMIREAMEKLGKELLESDHEYAYPTLNKLPGSPFSNIPKKVLAYSEDETNEIIYYLCSWH